MLLNKKSTKNKIHKSVPVPGCLTLTPFSLKPNLQVSSYGDGSDDAILTDGWLLAGGYLLMVVYTVTTLGPRPSLLALSGIARLVSAI